MTSLWWDLSCWPLVGVLRATSPWLNPQALLLLRGIQEGVVLFICKTTLVSSVHTRDVFKG